MPIFMKIEGVTGAVTAKNHEAWIEIDTMHFGMSTDAYTQPGHVCDRIRSQPHLDEIRIFKRTDQSSVSLFSYACSQHVLPQLIIECCYTADELSPYARYVLSNVIITQYDETHGGIHDHPQETLRLNFTAIEKTYFPRATNNQEISPLTAGYSIEQAIPL